MAKSGMAKGIINIIFFANILVVVLMSVTGYSYLIDPAKLPFAATWGMVFPLFAAADFLFLVFWLLLKPVKAFLPFAAFVFCYIPVRMYVGINPASKAPEGAMKVMSYNVLGFTGMDDNKLSKDSNRLVYFLVDNNPDILCMQEYEERNLSEDMIRMLCDKYPYHHFSDRGKGLSVLAIYSKYAITRIDSIPCDTCRNMSVAYTLSLPKGKVMVVNNHFESNKFSVEQKQKFKTIMLGDMDKDSMRMESKNIYMRLTEMSVKRNSQAKAVAEFVNMHKDMPVILCGDFNEVPVSYNRHIIAKLLNDCFFCAGLGLGWTYCHNGLRVRIDNIMCSDHFKPYECKVLSGVTYSDHYPITCRLNFEGKEK